MSSTQVPPRQRRWVVPVVVFAVIAALLVVGFAVAVRAVNRGGDLGPVAGESSAPSTGPSDDATPTADAIAFSDNPSNSSRVSTNTAEAFTSFSTFCEKAGRNVANSELIARSRVLSASESFAPARTKSR